MIESTRPRLVADAARFGRVAVLYGGQAAERSVSLKSGHAVLQALQRQGVAAEGIDVDNTVIERLQQGKYDRAFIVLHGRGGEDGVMQAVLQTLAIPYTGSGVLASALAMDKLLTKQCWAGVGLPTPPYAKLDGDAVSLQQAQALGFPLIVKPASEGSSLGMSKVAAPNDLVAAWKKAASYEARVFAEQWVAGAEYTATILDGQVLPLIRVEVANEFYDFNAKYESDKTRYLCPCGLAQEDEQRLQQVALQAFVVLGCSGWGRVDFLLDSAARPWLIEVNTVPGMTDHSLVPMAARAAGIEFDELVWRILETSFSADGSVDNVAAGART